MKPACIDIEVSAEGFVVSASFAGCLLPFNVTQLLPESTIPAERLAVYESEGQRRATIDSVELASLPIDATTHEANAP